MVPNRPCSRNLCGNLLLTLLLLRIHGIQSWIPPHPEFSDMEWEPVHEMRRRLNIEYNYTPRVIPAEMCRYVSEEDCEDADLSMRSHIASQKNIQKQRRRNPNLGKIKVGT